MNLKNLFPKNNFTKLHVLAGMLTVLTIGFYSAEQAMFGGTLTRNMISSETNLPAKWDPSSGMNIKWTAALGSQTYGNPVISGGKIFVGTNNEGKHNPKLTGDRGVVMCFNEADGKFLWQATSTKLASGRVNDWPLQGVCSSPFVEGDRLYYVSNRCEVVCLDTEGFYDKENDGPYQSEADTSLIDADIVWKLDMMGELDVFPHNLAVCSPIAVGDLLFIVTANGVDEGHIHIPSPYAPSFIAVNKNTGAVVWQDASPGTDIMHGQWSNPAYAVINNVPQVIFPGGDGVIYSFDPPTGKLIWKFNCNTPEAVYELGGSGTKNDFIATPVIYDNKVYIGLGQDPEHGEGISHLYCIDATQTGDVTKTAVVWHRGYKDFNRTMSTVAIHEGLLYVADLSGFVYCFDVKTGELYWKYDTYAAIWGSPYVVDGKVYIGDEDGDVAVLKAGKQMELLHEVNMGSAVYTTPVAKNGVLYITNRSTLFALQVK
jgi:outer membrane protein assembly factor BamB